MQKFYTIKDVSKRTGISAYTLRYYDSEGLLSFVQRSESG
ncbi:MAG: MerR family DNA-binding transcriptional regulator, partial [Solobacterium sp.]|nr:MerR family DNA-binding transcriptional regulator [Solobacterium sp.]